MLNRKNSKKLGFTLIEMLIVIVIIGILAAYLIPRITGAQGKARDVARKADVNQVVSAIFSAQLDGKVRTTNGNWQCVNSLTGLVPTYLSSIEKDPGLKQTLTGCDYYAAFVDGSNIAVAAHLEGEGGNATSNVLTKKNIGGIREELGKSTTGDYYVQIY